MKAAVLVFSDPKSGSDESLGRLFNALSTTYELQERGDDVTLLFQGAGTRWAGELTKADHPAHELYKAVEGRVAGVSCGCADVFGATEEAEASGFDLIKDTALPGTRGVSSVRNLISDGYSILTF